MACGARMRTTPHARSPEGAAHSAHPSPRLPLATTAYLADGAPCATPSGLANSSVQRIMAWTSQSVATHTMHTNTHFEARD